MISVTPLHLYNRTSKDVVLNKRGKEFLDFLASTNLTVLNGCTIGDIFGEFTYVNYNGKSVVDYTAISHNLKKLVNSFKVLDLTKYSDHKPTMCKLKVHGNFMPSEQILRDLEYAPRRYKWNAENNTSNIGFLAKQTDPFITQTIHELSTRQFSNKNDVADLNEKIVHLYHSKADEVLPPRKNVTKQSPVKANSSYRHTKAKNPWFDVDCIVSKRELKRLARCYGSSPTNDELRHCYYQHKKEYRSLIKTRKEDFFLNLSSEIEAGNGINWGNFKKLKGYTKKESKLDAFDFLGFCRFFKNLYGKKSLSEASLSELKSDRPDNEIEKGLTDILDKEISLQELSDCIHNCKNGKAVAEDLILNEFLKASGQEMLHLLLLLFNKCLEFGVYPWSTSLVTPLHKKGSVYDPNNYRAIAVASNLGKLFSSILLQRLLSFRQVSCPDTPNQLGFCKQAQTADHILVLTTIIDKYVKKQKGRIYSCFVDYAKAFDSVCREALLHKLWKFGVRGKFYNCLEEMYNGSTAKIKLLNKLSEKIDLLCGTEQGHPMSPELFKCFIHQLSLDLNNITGAKIPELNSVRVTHLLWADDLVLLALDHKSLQSMLDILFTYCNDWGLTVNTSKTSVMIFNNSGRQLKESNSFKFGTTEVPSSREYCYLGVTFSLNGSLKLAQEKLRQKGLRSYFALKRMLDIRGLRKTVIFRLFDALISPVVSYGCQIWLPTTHAFRQIQASLDGNNSSISPPSLPKIALDPLERLHLSFLKWTLGVNKYTSNAAVWGDSGRHPLVITHAKQVFSYMERLKRLESDNSPALVRHALKEQEMSSLGWFTGLQNLKTSLERAHQRDYPYPSQIRAGLKIWFENTWDAERRANKKLNYYNSIKEEFGPELYLNLHLGYWESKHLAQLRTSSHSYNIETGRHGQKRSTIVNRLCPNCTHNMDDTMALLAELPFFDPILEDEHHILLSCPSYNIFRNSLTEAARTTLREDPQLIFKSAPFIRELSNFLKKTHDRRFPKQCLNTKNKSTQTINF